MAQETLDFDELDEVKDQRTTVDSLADDEIIDYITGDPVKMRGNEEVRQEIARALFHEYGISVDDMARDFPIPIQVQGGRNSRKKADIAIFKPGTVHHLDNLQRVVVCKPKPKAGRTATKIRTFQQAQQDLEELEVLLGTEKTPNAEYGMWANGIDFFFLHKVTSRFGAKFEPLANWPVAPDSVGTRSVASTAKLRRGEAAMLRTAFRRCHNYIHGNEGMQKDTAFWQFLYLLFAKIHDERTVKRTGQAPRFYALHHEPFDGDGQKAIAARIKDLFTEVKTTYPHFGNRDEITISPAAQAFIVGELASYDLSGTDMDVKGIAYQELVGTNLRGDLGQYFTPKGAVELMVDILEPKEHEIVLDPACGTGGFLRETLHHLLEQWKKQDGTVGLPDTEEQIQRLAAFTDRNLFGADFDQNLVRATTMSLMTLTGGTGGNVYHMDSLKFPFGDLAGNDRAQQRIPLGTVDVLMTNPPFGTDIKVEDPKTLNQYREGVARSWTRNRETGELEPGRSEVTAMSPEQLFIQRAVDWVRPGGRIGIVLPNGILSNPGPTDEAIRRWILDNCWVLASIELPVETFIVEANVNILTSLVFLKKKTDAERMAASMGGAVDDYSVFMAVAEKVGVDRRGNPLYRRSPDGELILATHEEVERIPINGRHVTRRLVRKGPIPDNDLPVIAQKYHEFRRMHEEWAK
ncbi:methylation-associated defense system DNA methyltransferase MAD2 [Nocardia asiatica]|uniref:methylation-associated defense system DNA methyltransferase MAD2 n=1 Tax=Nocardia asiatica TaxID=209252 RepID=UPI0024574D0B|nr:N-6 DNA methylase [Nocardia asiatica]